MDTKKDTEGESTEAQGITDYITTAIFGKNYNVVDDDTNTKSERNGNQNHSFNPKVEDVSDENGNPLPPSSPDADSGENNVTGNTVERGNPLRFNFHRWDKADRHQVRYDPDEEDLVAPDDQRKQITKGTYDDQGNVGSYFGDPNQSQHQTTDERPGMGKSSRSRSSLGNNRGKPIERDQEDHDADELHNSWKRRFSKIARPPTGGPETPGSEGRKWRDLKNSILGFKKKDRLQAAPVVDTKKERIQKELDEKTKQRAEFMISSLIAGCPAALFASSIFLRDEHGTQRAPLLLSLLGFQLVDITENAKHKHKTYRIDLEYGLSPNRLKWSIIKDTKDFLLLHSRLKVLFFQSNAFSRKDVELPKLPRWDHQAKIARHKFSETQANTNANNVVLDGGITNYRGEQYVVPSNLSVNSHTQNPDVSDIGTLISNSSAASHRFRQTFDNLLTKIHSMSSKQDKTTQELSTLNDLFKESMEHYIDQLAITLTLRPQANRVFQFFELSPIGVLLSSEHGYQGKQGYLLVRTSAKAQGWRVGHLKFRELKDMVERHTNKWFLIRNSYIMYVDDIYSTTPLEVFLIDSSIVVDFTGADDQFPKNALDSDDEGSLLDEMRNTNDVKKKSPYLVIKLENNERKMKMIVRSEKQLNLWLTSINQMISKTVWSQPKRFGSFAPVRDQCFGQWFVDARDYMWACSSALEMAKETIYIHDWWLSPELYMRRPANGNQEWRLDRILKRKAELGVKIFVIVYRNVGNTVVTDSSWTKHSLLDLHPNVYVIRSPNQLLQNTYFWAHHEKLCIVDSTICFLGGIDLCFGRFDTPDHILTDDADSAFVGTSEENEESIKYQYFPGKDYSNPRVKDFFSLDKPYESMYDRKEIPRMPWHDVHMISSGQIARDLSRHFVQRWNYLLRQKRPSRPTPLLLPPSDLTQEEISEMGLDGTCEIQLLRSSGNWSLGLKNHEHSIQDAYLKVIETSEHFVYLENQFFITSSEWEGVVIQNRIGDALVDRIIRAHTEGKDWRAVIVIPLMPGFESQVSEAEGSSVRVIMKCQFMSISRGSTSIFAKLRKVGIDPDDYIQFFSLRKWGKIGPDRRLVTEQLYIHAKTLMADDRVAIIGSANINERSMRGDRDSEVAAIVRDKEMIKTTMNGKPYFAGKFAHTLRMRLMREHLGVDVDILELVERRFNQLEEIAKTDIGKLASTGKFASEQSHIASAMVELATREVLNQPDGSERWIEFSNSIGGDTSIKVPLDEEELPESFENSKKYPPLPLFHSFNYRAGVENLGMRDKKKFSSDSRIHNNKDHKDDIDGLGKDGYKSAVFERASKNFKRLLQEWAKDSVKPKDTFLPNIDQILAYLNDDGIDYNGHLSKDLELEEEKFLSLKNLERWQFLKRVSYMQRCATKQKTQEKEANAKKDRDASLNTNDSNLKPNILANFANDTRVMTLDDQGIQDALQTFVSIGDSNYKVFIDPYGFEDPLDDEFYEDVWYANAVRNTRIYRMIFHCQPDDAAETWNDYTQFYNLESEFEKSQKQEFSNKLETETSAMGNGGAVKPVTHPSNVMGVLGAPGGRSREEETASASASTSGGPGNDDDYMTDSSKTRDSLPSSSTPSTSDDGELKQELNGKKPISSEQNTTPLEEDKKMRERKARRRRAGTFASRHRNATVADTIYDKLTAEKLLSHIQGHLVLFPANWLHRELEKGGSWFFNADRLPPIEIYD